MLILVFLIAISSVLLFMAAGIILANCAVENSDVGIGFIVILINAVILITVSFKLYDTYYNEELYDRAVQQGYAHYHPKTKELVWDDTKIEILLLNKELKGDK